MGPYSANRWLPLLLMSVAMGGCVIVPYKPQAEVVKSRDIVIDSQRIIVTQGPRKQIGELTEAIKSLDEAITVVSPQEFMDVAFLDTDLTLERMLEPATCARVRDQLGTDYLILVGEATQRTTDTKGIMVVAIGFYGAKSTKEHATALATVIDLKNAKPLVNVNSRAEGNMMGIGAFYGLFVWPMTGTSAKEGLARGVVSAMREDSGPGPLRIAVLAAQGDSGASAPP